VRTRENRTVRPFVDEMGESVVLNAVGRTMRSWGGLCVALLLLTAHPVSPQGGVFSVAGGGGNLSSRIGGTFFNFRSLELRWEPNPARIAPIAIAGFQITDNSCSESLPPQCGFPGDAAPFGRAGFSAVADLGSIRLVATPSLGVLRWGEEWDPSLRLETGVRFDFGASNVEMELALRGERIWISRRTGSVSVDEGGANMIGIQVGMRFADRR
jgi:hypothetical protein